MRTLFFTMMIVACAAPAFSQERSLVRKGNELYNQQQYKQAAAAYEEALKNKPQFVPGAFNLGNALIQQKQFDAARKVMDNTTKTSKDPMVQSGAQYNKGNTFMSEQQWQEAINSYKQALRRNPADQDAKYNLSYALEKLKKQGGGKDNNKNQDKKDDKKQDEKQQKGDDKKDKKDEKEGDNKQQHEQSKPSPGKLTEQQADNMLKALQQDERKTQDKMQQSKATPVKLEKDW